MDKSLESEPKLQPGVGPVLQPEPSALTSPDDPVVRLLLARRGISAQYAIAWLRTPPITWITSTERNVRSRVAQALEQAVQDGAAECVPLLQCGKMMNCTVLYVRSMLREVFERMVMRDMPMRGVHRAPGLCPTVSVLLADQKALGMSMRVERSSLHQVQERFEKLKREQDQKPLTEEGEGVWKATQRA